MPDLGLEVLLKGSNMLRLLQGLWVALRISLIAVVISIPLGLLFGVLMTRKNVVLKAIFRVYLEFIRIMPQLVFLSCFTLVRRELLAGICRERQRPSSCLSCGAPQR